MEPLIDKVKLGNVRIFGSAEPDTRTNSRNQYTPVSSEELTPAASELWNELPDQVKYDPALERFRQLYEKEYGATKQRIQANGKSTPRKRLPLVKSAPHLHDNEIVKGVVGLNEFALNLQNKSLSEHSENPENPEPQIKKKKSKVHTALKILKITCLLAVWLFFTVTFMLYNEKIEVTKHTYIGGGETKDYVLRSSEPSMRTLISVQGPFWSDIDQRRAQMKNLNTTVNVLNVWVEKWVLTEPGNGSQEINKENVIGTLQSEPWQVCLVDDNKIDFAEGVERSKLLTFSPYVTHDNQHYVYVIKMNTTLNGTTPLTFRYLENPLKEHLGVIYATILLCGLYVLIIFEIINRTLAAVVTSTASLAVLAMVGERPSLTELVSWLDTETLLLLFSMMLLVAITAETGFFDYIAVYAFKVTKGRMWPLINLLCFLTAFLSSFLDNVTTVLLMTPVVIRLCEVMNLNPVPILMAMVIYSNIGGTATPVGDPPNVIISSNRYVIESGVNFTNFTLHMSVGIILVCLQTYFQLRWMYRDMSKLRHSYPKDLQEIKQQITVWSRAAASLSTFTQEEKLVKCTLEDHIEGLQSELDLKVRESNKRAVPKDTFAKTLHELEQKYKIRNKPLLMKSVFAISFVVVLFFLHAIPELQRISLGWTALLGAIMLLILADREDLEPILHRVEWATLLFFASLFVLMEALSKLGLISWLGGLTENLIYQVDESGRLAVALILMLWVSGIASAFVDNIPLTTMMIRVVTSIGMNPNLNLPMEPLIWALSFGACLGGNGTLIGASANVVCAGVAEQHGYKFSFMQFFKVGFPIMIGHLLVATVYLLVCHCLFSWH